MTTDAPKRSDLEHATPIAVSVPGGDDLPDADGESLRTPSTGPFDGRSTWVRTSPTRTGAEDTRATLLMLHGATVPGWHFDRLVPHLEQIGIRCVRPDFFGHGDSDRPRGRYALDRFVDQTCHVVDTYCGTAPLFGLGHSLGAAVLAATASRLPGRFNRLVLVAPMLDYLANSTASHALRVPVLGELLMHLYAVPMLRRRRRARYTPIGCAHLADRFDAQVKRPGFAPALLSMFRNGTLSDQSRHYAALGRLGLPTLVLAGANDAVVTPTQLERIGTLTGTESLVTVPGCEHNFLMSHPHEALPHLTAFLTESGRTPPIGPAR